ncbi:hypothetical protein S245_067916 [Arachis hypogaea]
MHDEDLHRPAPRPSPAPPAAQGAAARATPPPEICRKNASEHRGSGLRHHAEPCVEHGVLGGRGGPGVQERGGVQGGGVADHGGRREGERVGLFSGGEVVGLAGNKAARESFIFEDS